MAHPASNILKPVLETSLDAAIIMRADGTVAAWNRVAETVFGWSEEEAVDRLLAELIVPPIHRDAHMQGLRRYLETGRGAVLNRRIEIGALHKDGRELVVELAITPTQDQGETVFLGFLRDITERRRAEVTLRESEGRLRATYQHAFAGIAETDAEGFFLRANEEFCRITGYSEAELRRRTFLQITRPEDREPDRTNYQRQWRGELDSYVLEKRYIHKDGHDVWIEVSASLVRDSLGAAAYGIRIVRDISERKLAEERQQLLIHELNHRVKNMLAIVQAIAQQSFKGAAVPPEYRHAFEGRLAALASAHHVITQANWQSTGLRTIVAVVLQPYRSAAWDPFRIEGPDLPIIPKTAVTLAMALHELATNAAKYGALSSRTGTVSVQWSVEKAGAEPRLLLSWKEKGGPQVVMPERRGFGSRMIEGALAAELGGKVSLDFRPDGLLCRIDAPVPGGMT